MKKLLTILLISLCFASCCKDDDLPTPKGEAQPGNTNPYGIVLPSGFSSPMGLPRGSFMIDTTKIK